MFDTISQIFLSVLCVYEGQREREREKERERERERERELYQFRSFIGQLRDREALLRLLTFLGVNRQQINVVLTQLSQNGKQLNFEITTTTTTTTKVITTNILFPFANWLRLAHTIQSILSNTLVCPKKHKKHT
jgi:hypothetical protein